ncbi:MAG TPA: hypothetical protein VFN73_10095 [Propionibacteriaceae bacterium]|nr:hypothetical protein [Propionibacteriaceae bacterium]
MSARVAIVRGLGRFRPPRAPGAGLDAGGGVTGGGGGGVRRDDGTSQALAAGLGGVGAEEAADGAWVLGRAAAGARLLGRPALGAWFLARAAARLSSSADSASSMARVRSSALGSLR